MLNYIKYFGFILVFQFPSCKGIGQSKIPEDIRNEVKYRIDNHFCSGIAIGVIDSLGAEYFCYGKLAYNSDKLVDKNTVFEIGSISKIYVSLILAYMVEDSLIALNDPISKYLPDSIHIPTLNNVPITIEHLSTHTSGLPYELEPLDLFNYYKIFPNNLYEFLAHIKDTLVVGKHYQYSNIGADLLFQILIDRSGLSYDELLNKYIIKPYKLKNTYSIHDSIINDNIAAGYKDENIMQRWDMTYVLLSSASDLTLFLMTQFIYHNKENAIKNTQLMHFKIDNDKYKGLAWSYNDNYKIYQHGGGTSGFRCFIGYSKKNKRGVVLLANSIFADFDIFNRLLDTSFNLFSYRPVNIDITTLRKYVGYFMFEKKNFGINIYINKTKLYIDWGDNAEELLPLGNDKFFIKSEDVIFTFNEKGNLISGVEYAYSIGKKGFLTKMK
jgi:CubicO group peptidase (beta-lactamase class C family)